MQYTNQPFVLPEFTEILKRREEHFQQEATKLFERIAGSVINNKEFAGFQIQSEKIALMVRQRFIKAGWPAYLIEKFVDDGSSPLYKVWEITFTGL